MSLVSLSAPCPQHASLSVQLSDAKIVALSDGLCLSAPSTQTALSTTLTHLSYYLLSQSLMSRATKALKVYS